jgi:PAS domain S-box-containing protein
VPVGGIGRSARTNRQRGGLLGRDIAWFTINQRDQLEVPMRAQSRQYLWGPVLVLFITLAATATVVWQLLRVSAAEDAARFDRLVATTQQALEDQAEAYAALLGEGATLFASGREPSPPQFRAFATRINLKKQYPASRSGAMQSSDIRYPGLLGVSWMRRDPETATGAAAAKPPDGLAPVMLDGATPARFGFVYIEPQEWRTQMAGGTEMFTDAKSRAAMEYARDNGRPAISGKVTVIREFWAKKRAGFHIFVPVYGGRTPPASLSARREALRGFIHASVQSDEMFSAVHSGDAGRELDLQVYDDAQTSQDALLYRSDLTRPSWDAGYRPRFATSVAADLPGRSWGMTFTSRPEFDQASERGIATNVAVFGVLLSLLLAGINLVQRRASAALNASEVRYRRLFEASPDGVFLFDADSGRVTDVNPYMTELLGRSREELLAGSLWNIGLFQDETRGRDVFAELQQKSYQRYDHLSIVTAAGQRRDVEFTCNAYMSDRRRVMQCNVRNITDRKRAEAALRDSEERYRSLVEISPQGVWIVDRSGTPVFINQYWLEYSGTTLEQSARGGWMDRIHPEDRDRAIESWKRAYATQSAYEAELRMKRAADGEYRWHLARGVPVRDAADRIDKWLGVFIDIDERKQTEQERVQLLQLEHALRTQAEAANRAKDDFLATLSHELRTPLNAILGWTQTLQHGDADRATVQRALSQIDASANAQAKLVNDLLNVADIGSGRMRLDIQAVDLIPLIDAIVESLRPAIAARDITLDALIDPEAGVLSGDPARLQQIVWNLLSNAVKFTPHGGHITLGLSRSDSHVEISVTDDGEGIGAEFLPYVFDRFRQADASIKRRHGGLGLGLAIVRHLAELHGGTVTAESAGEGRGSRFAVQLPIVSLYQDSQVRAPAAPPRTSEGKASPRVRPLPRLTGLRILSVDDDPNTREMLQEALERAGAEVISAASAPEAMEKLRASRPHVLLSDIGLPEEDGYDLLRKVRALSAADGGNTPAVALTGYARDQDYQAAMAAGYQEFVAKPVNLEELSSAILRANEHNS